MNYVTQDYTPERVSTPKDLELPLVERKVQGGATFPCIFGGKAYRVLVRKCVVAESEDGVSPCFYSEEGAFLKGAFAANKQGILVEVKDGTVRRYRLDDLNLVGEINDGVIYDPRAVCSGDSYFLMCQDRKGLGEPIGVGRMDMRGSEFFWKFYPDYAISSFSVSPDESQIVVTDSKGCIYSLDVQTGKCIWKTNIQKLGVLTVSELNHRSTSGLSLRDNPHIYGETVALGYVFDYMSGIDLHSGELKWKKKIESNVPYTTVDSEGNQYFLRSDSQSTTLLIIDCETGEIIREVAVQIPPDVEGKFTSSLYSDVTRTHFLAASGKGLLYAVNLKSGEIDWHHDLQGNLSHNPFFICNNRLYISTTTEQFVFEGQGGYIAD